MNTFRKNGTKYIHVVSTIFYSGADYVYHGSLLRLKFLYFVVWEHFNSLYFLF